MTSFGKSPVVADVWFFLFLKKKKVPHLRLSNFILQVKSFQLEIDRTGKAVDLTGWVFFSLFFSNSEMYINPQRSVLMHRAPVSLYQCHPAGLFAAAAAAAEATAAVLTVDVHRWQHHRHLGPPSFVVAGGRKEEMILRTSRGGRSAGVKTQLNDEAKKVTGCSRLIMENWR